MGDYGLIVRFGKKYSKQRLFFNDNGINVVGRPERIWIGKYDKLVDIFGKVALINTDCYYFVNGDKQLMKPKKYILKTNVSIYDTLMKNDHKKNNIGNYVLLLVMPR